MGRAAEPAQAKVLKGNFRPDRHSHGPAVPAGVPKCPRWLPPKARRAWREVSRELAKHGLISKVDGAAFALHCDTLAKYEEACAQMAELDDMIASTPNGYAVQSAWFTIRTQLFKQLMETSREFGLTPAARSKVKDIGQQQLPLGGDDWSDL